jgi:hypothetical protein
VRLATGPDFGGHAALDLVRALRAMPLDVRRFAASRVALVLLTGDGLAIPPALIGGDAGRWVIALRADAPSLPALVAHEVGHAIAGDTKASADEERSAAAFARGLGLHGAAADADLAVALLDVAQRRAPRFRARVSGASVVLTCQKCGADASVLAAPVAGLRAGLIAAECIACGSAGAVLLDVALACQTCNAPVFATWTRDSTDDAPRVEVECSKCGTESVLGLRCEPATQRPTPSGATLREAARLLLGAEESVRRMGHNADADMLTQSSVAATLALVLRRIRVGAALLGADPRMPLLDDATRDVEAAARLLASGDFASAAERLATASGQIDALARATR